MLKVNAEEKAFQKIKQDIIQQSIFLKYDKDQIDYFFKKYDNKQNIIVDLSERKLYIVRKQEVIKEFTVGVGVIRNNKSITKTGIYSLGRLYFNPTNEKYKEPFFKDNNNGFGPMLIDLCYEKVNIPSRLAIHGTALMSEYLLNLDNRYVSHGCVRLKNNEMIEFSRLVNYGDKVLIMD